MIPSILGTTIKTALAAPAFGKLKKATDAFETNFVKQLVTEMRKSEKSEFGDVPGSEIYDDMTNQALSEKLSSNGNFGISATLYKSLSKLALAQQNEPKR